MHRLDLVPAVSIALLAMACAPNNAVLTSGEYVAFISTDTSSSLAANSIAIADWGKDTYNVDCRLFESLSEKEADALRLPDALDICPKELGPNQVNGPKDQNGDGFDDNYDWPGDNLEGPDHEEWLFQGPFSVVHEKMEPWRGEAIVTSEGDLQIGFHHRLPGGADMRFAFAIDPDMAPTTCVQENGKVKAEPIDGDWLEEWSNELVKYTDPAAHYRDVYEEEYGSKKAADEAIEDIEAAFAHMQKYIDGGGRLWVLNASSYQLNPQATDDFWFFPEEFQAGFAAGKFAEERFAARGSRYGEPIVYNTLDADSALGASIPESLLWHCDMEEGVDPSAECQRCLSPGSGWIDHCEVQDRAKVVEQEIFLEMELVNPNEVETLNYRPLIIENDWRVPDGRPPGLDGWTELHYNYVVIDEKSNLEVGGNVKGAFTLVFDSENTKSRFFVKGEFEVEKIKKDRWTADDLRAIKLEESDDVKNEDSLCISK